MNMAVDLSDLQWYRVGAYVIRHVEAEEGAVAQLGEHLLCKQGVGGSIPLSSTRFCNR